MAIETEALLGLLTILAVGIFTISPEGSCIAPSY